MVIAVENIHWAGLVFLSMIWFSKMWLGTDKFIHIRNIIESGVFQYSSGLDEEDISMLEETNSYIIR